MAKILQIFPTAIYLEDNVLDAKEDLRYDTTDRNIDRVIAKLGKTINQLEADKLELSKAIVLNRECYSHDRDINFCTFCGEDYINNIPKHKEDCIVVKSSKYLGERSERD